MSVAAGNSAGGQEADGSVRLDAFIPRALMADARRVASEEERSVAGVVRLALRAYVERAGERREAA